MASSTPCSFKYYVLTLSTPTSLNTLWFATLYSLSCLACVSLCVCGCGGASLSSLLLLLLVSYLYTLPFPPSPSLPPSSYTTLHQSSTSHSFNSSTRCNHHHQLLSNGRILFYLAIALHPRSTKTPSSSITTRHPNIETPSSRKKEDNNPVDSSAPPPPSKASRPYHSFQ